MRYGRLAFLVVGLVSGGCGEGADVRPDGTMAISKGPGTWEVWALDGDTPETVTNGVIFRLQVEDGRLVPGDFSGDSPRGTTLELGLPFEINGITIPEGVVALDGTAVMDGGDLVVVGTASALGVTLDAELLTTWSTEWATVGDPADPPRMDSLTLTATTLTESESISAVLVLWMGVEDSQGANHDSEHFVMGGGPILGVHFGLGDEQPPGWIQ